MVVGTEGSQHLHWGGKRPATPGKKRARSSGLRGTREILSLSMSSTLVVGDCREIRFGHFSQWCLVLIFHRDVSFVSFYDNIGLSSLIVLMPNCLMPDCPRCAFRSRCRFGRVSLLPGPSSGQHDMYRGDQEQRHSVMRCGLVPVFQAYATIRSALCSACGINSRDEHSHQTSRPHASGRETASKPRSS